jgi:hypothetical protein
MFRPFQADSRHSRRAVTAAAVAVAVAIVVTACSVEPAPPRDERVALLDFAAMKVVPFDEDPFAAELSSAVTCAAAAVTTDEGMLEISTNACNHVTLRGVLLDEMREGETLRLLFWHLYLYAGVDAVTGEDVVTTGHAELRIGGTTWWKAEPAIPGKEAIYKPTWTVDKAVPAGTEVIVHVHNHGANSWRLIDLTTGN